MIKYVCKKKCTYGGRLWEKDEELETDAKNVPNHFDVIAEMVDSEPERKGRGNPNWIKKQV